MISTHHCYSFCFCQLFFFFSPNSFWTFPKQLLFHQVRSFSHFATFCKIMLSEFRPSKCLHATSTVSPHLELDNHISSNLNIFCFTWISKPNRLKNRGKWSEVLHERWCTLAPGNFRNQLLFAIPLSNLSQIETPLSKCLLQVYLEPTNPMSIKLHSSITSLNNYIWLWLRKAPSNFSSWPIISLKSPVHNHGLFMLQLSLLSFSHASPLLVVFGSP